jgi:transcriptional antiterminator RfaH
MPVLPPEPSSYPEHLLDADVCGPTLAERAWWVLHTRPRQEKRLARQLREKETPFYLPLVCRRSSCRRTLTSHLPLFPGYVFLFGARGERITALTTDRVVRALEVVDQQGLWRDLRRVHRLIGSGVPLSPEERLEPGVTVEIRSGPLAGLRGKLVRAASGRKFVVEVDFIQRGVSVVLDDCALAKIEPEPEPVVGSGVYL